MRDHVLERRGRRPGRLLAPELVEQPVGRDDAPGVQREDAKKRSLLVPPECDRARVALDFERSKQADVKHALFVTPVSM